MADPVNFTILVVDDTEANIDVLVETLGDEYDISVAMDGMGALESVAESPPDLVLLDIMMPEMDGYEVCRRLKADEATKDIPVIFVTAMHDIGDETKGFELGAVDYIAKPISPPIVQSRVKSVLDLKQKTDELTCLSTELSRYLSPQVYQSLFAGERKAQIESQRKKLTIFFSDIVDFTKTTENLEAEEISLLLNSYLDAMAEIAIKHGGTIDKFVGDAVMIFFGDPVSRGIEEDARSCVAMALEMVEALGELQKSWINQGIAIPFKVRIGINTGYCTVGNFGSKSKMDYTIIGNQVNISKRLEEAAFEGQVIISHETWALVKEVFYCIKKIPISVKGIQYPIQNYQVVGRQDQVEEFERQTKIGLFVTSCDTVEPSASLRDTQLGRRLDDTFDALVVVQDKKPLGLLMNYHLCRIMSSQSQKAQFFDSPVTEIMDTAALIIDSHVTTDDVIRQVIAREPGKIYDHIIITEDDELLGIVTVPDLLKFKAGIT